MKIYGDGVTLPVETLAGDHLSDFDTIWNKATKYDGNVITSFSIFIV